MCYNCGCGLPDDDMGVGTALLDGKSITNETFRKLAEKWEMTEVQAKEFVYDLLAGKISDEQKEKFLSPIYDEAGMSQGMTTEEAKEETYKLLKQVLDKKD